MTKGRKEGRKEGRIMMEGRKMKEGRKKEGWTEGKTGGRKEQYQRK